MSAQLPCKFAAWYAAVVHRIPPPRGEDRCLSLQERTFVCSTVRRALYEIADTLSLTESREFELHLNEAGRGEFIERLQSLSRDQ